MWEIGCSGTSLTLNGMTAAEWLWTIEITSGRWPDEPVDADLGKFYGRLLAVLRQPAVREGRWQLLECDPAWDGNWTWDCFLAFAWHGSGEKRLLVAVNYAANQSQCFVRLPFSNLTNNAWRFRDCPPPMEHAWRQLLHSQKACAHHRHPPPPAFSLPDR